MVISFSYSSVSVPRSIVTLFLLTTTSNAGKSSEDGIWFGTSEPDDSKGALLYDTYEIEELACESNKGMKLIPAFEVVVSLLTDIFFLLLDRPA